MGFPFPTETIKEGQADLIIPRLQLYSKSGSEYIPHLAPVFYNPRMRLNRDIAVIVLQTYQKKIGRPVRVSDPFSGCGVRGIRFALEVNGIAEVETNDISSHAAELTKANVIRNHVEEKVKVSNLDCNLFLTINVSSRSHFDAIDLDPFGSPSYFMDPAVRAVANHGILAVTATDTPPLCGVKPDACLRKYFGRPLRSEYCHEVALRLIISALALTAARYNLGLKVLLSYSVDHYFRVHAQIDKGAKHANAAIRNLGYILHCFRCLNRTWVLDRVQGYNPYCPRCGTRMQAGGPLWLSHLVDKEFCLNMIAEAGKTDTILDRAKKLLMVLIEEAEAEPTYYVLDKVCDRLNLPVPPIGTVVNQLRDRGFSATRTHFGNTALKTNASIAELEETIQKVKEADKKHSQVS